MSAEEKPRRIPWPRNNAELLAALIEWKRRPTPPPAAPERIE